MTDEPAASAQVARAAERQPSNFEGLDAPVVSVDRFSVTRSLACRCGSDLGHLLAGEYVDGGRLDPLSWACAACGSKHIFFDSARDGYDARLGNGTSYDQAEEQTEVACPDCGGRLLAVACRLIHNIDSSELDAELGPERADQIPDLFDALAVAARCGSCAREFAVADWELA